MPPDQEPARTRPVRFLVHAEHEAGLLPRLLVPFARRDVATDRVRADRQGRHLRVSLDVDAMDSAMVHLVEGNLRQIIGVLRVEVELRACLKAA